MRNAVQRISRVQLSSTLQWKPATPPPTPPHPPPPPIPWLHVRPDSSGWLAAWLAVVPLQGHMVINRKKRPPSLLLLLA